MEGVIFIGIQATGKSSFYKKSFFRTHLRINLDMLRTRNREKLLFNACIEAKQSLVIDNTNPTVKDRQKYIDTFKKAKFKVVGYYFQSNLKYALHRNETRIGKEKISKAGILNTYNKLELPTYNEGFDELYYVSLDHDTYVVKEWRNEI